MHNRETKKYFLKKQPFEVVFFCFLTPYVKGGDKVKKKNYREIAVREIEKLALCKTNDVLYLMFSKEVPEPAAFKKIDFSYVTEIKRDKDGGLQVKFVDRQSLFESLVKLTSEEKNENDAANFLNTVIGKDGE